MSKIDAFSRVFIHKVKTRFYMDFQLMDDLNMTEYIDLFILKNMRATIIDFECVRH